MSIHAFIDTIVDDAARLFLGDAESIDVVVPLAWLPDGTREGDCLLLSFEHDRERTLSSKTAVKDIMDRLPDNP